MSTTNQEKPFIPGETIDYCDEHYVVVANYGSSGKVREAGTDGRVIDPFYWKFADVECRRVTASVK
jgi:hypothetical protein